MGRATWHALALKKDGTVWAWGDNTYGQLGDNTTTQRNEPVAVQGLAGVATIAGGLYHSLAVKTGGTLWAWGYNGNGQLGDDTTTNRIEPVQVQNLTGVAATAGGWSHSLALKSDGTVWAWGENQDGQLGDNLAETTGARTRPGAQSHGSLGRRSRREPQPGDWAATVHHLGDGHGLGRDGPRGGDDERPAGQSGDAIRRHVHGHGELRWSGTVTPTLTGYTFTPTSNTYASVAANQTANYTAATVQTFTISGSVTDLYGDAIAGVAMSGLPGSPTTQSDGTYTGTVNSGWSGTVTPTLAGYTFSPTSNTYAGVAANQTGTYTGTLQQYTISGYVTTSSGAPISGVTMSGLPGYPVTQSDGSYTATVNYGWSGTVTPTLAGYDVRADLEHVHQRDGGPDRRLHGESNSSRSRDR